MKNRYYKAYLVIIAGFVIIAGAILYVVQYSTSAIISELNISQARMANRALVNYLHDFEEIAMERAEIVANNTFIIESLLVRDYQTLDKALENLGEGMDFATVCDENGIVLARSSSDDVGDDISDFDGIAPVIEKRSPISTIEHVPTRGFVISASSAIYDGDEFIGIIACGFDLQNSKYLEAFKLQNDCEACIFYGDERVSTTLTGPERKIGAKADTEIVDAVINNAGYFTDRLTLTDGHYRSYYSPITVDGEPIGMLFTGINIDSALNRQHNMQQIIILIAVAALAAAVVFFVVLSKFNRAFANTLEELSDKTSSLNILENVLDAMSIFLYVTDPENDRILFTNKALVEHMELKRSVIGEYCYEVFQIGMETRCDYCSLDKLMQNPDQPVSWEAYNTITGRYYRNIDRLVKWPDGRTVHFCQRIDITEMKQVQDMLVRTSSIVQSSPNFVAFKKLTGECTFVNDAASTITGYSREELLENDYVELMMDEETVHRIKNEIYPLVIETGVQVYEAIAKMKDGRVKIFSVSTFLVEADEQAFGTVATDITEKKQFEKRMQKALEKAEQANRAKSDFLSRMSHEMRTPMNAIFGMINLAQKAEDPEEARDYLKRINHSAEHLLGIINDILDMSKIEAGKLELVESTVVLENILDRVTAVMEIKFKEKNQHFSVHVGEGVPEAFITDGQKLAQIITNLLGNANKFTPENGNVSLRVLNGDNCRLLFEVEDDGAGISKEQHQKLFDAFEQADNTITRQFGGTGLGLAIAKNMISLMGGEIWVESEPGKGSKFNFTISVKDIDSGENICQDSDAGADKEDTITFAGKNILVADDVEINREILAALLSDMDINVDCAENGLEAYNKFAANPEGYDLIFMDIHMPEINGYEATGKIRDLDIPQASTIPIIAVTADVFSQDIEKCISAGMNDHIGKPLNMDTLIAKMQKYLI